MNRERQKRRLEGHLHHPGCGERVPPVTLRDAYNIDATGEPAEQRGDLLLHGAT
jgi:hypothetical protein